MSLINKMLNDLDKRNALLNDDKQTLLNDLQAASHIELESDKKNYLFVIITSILIFIVVVLYYFDNLRSVDTALTNKKISGIAAVDEGNVTVVKKRFNNPEKRITKIHGNNLIKNIPIKKISTNNSDDKINTGPSLNLIKKELSVDKIDQHEKSANLNYSLKIENEESNDVTEENFYISDDKQSRIESISFEEINNNISLVIQSDKEFDYVVYSLTAPDRIVLEVTNTEVAFVLDDINLMRPIVAIRYSMTNTNTLKFVIESEQPLWISNSTIRNNNGRNNLVVVMDQVFQNRNTNIDYDQKNVHVQKYENVKNVNDLFIQAQKDYRDGNIEKSIEKLNIVLKQDAGHIDARSTLAKLLYDQGQNEKAYSLLNEGLLKIPNQIEWIDMYARILYENGSLVDANNLLSQHKPEISDYSNYYALYAVVLQKLNEHEKSAKIYRDLLKYNPTNPVWWMGLAISLESLKRYEDAVYAYQQASSNRSLVKESRDFVNQRIITLDSLIKNEST